MFIECIRLFFLVQHENSFAVVPVPFKYPFFSDKASALRWLSDYEDRYGTLDGQILLSSVAIDSVDAVIQIDSED